MSAEVGPHSPNGEVVFDLTDGDLYLHGDRDQIDRLLAQILSPSELASRNATRVNATDGLAAAATAGALLSTAQEYLRLTPESLAKVHQFGMQVDGAGAMRGYVRSGGKFAGNLTFQNVSFGPEQALALQTAAVTLALRSAIADVQKAIEEVQDSVDALSRRARAQEVGRVLGLYEHLDSVVSATQRRGRLLQADWDSISGAGTELRQSLHALRAYAQSTMATFDADARVPKRAQYAAAMSDPDDIGGTLKLIAVAEKALHLWEYLRIEHIRQTDPDHVESELVDARDSLNAHRRHDAELVTMATEKLEALREISPLEIHRRFSIPELEHSTAQALDALTQFAAVARTEMPGLERQIRRPEFAEARAEVKHRAIEAKDGAVAFGKTLGHATSETAKKAADRVSRPLRDRSK